MWSFPLTAKGNNTYRKHEVIQVIQPKKKQNNRGKEPIEMVEQRERTKNVDTISHISVIILNINELCS